jgi:hypothetical protein
MLVWEKRIASDIGERSGILEAGNWAAFSVRLILSTVEAAVKMISASIINLGLSLRGELGI